MSKCTVKPAVHVAEQKQYISTKRQHVRMKTAQLSLATQASRCHEQSASRKMLTIQKLARMPIKSRAFHSNSH